MGTAFQLPTATRCGQFADQIEIGGGAVGVAQQVLLPPPCPQQTAIH